MKKVLLMAAAMLFACTANLFAQEGLSWVGDGTASRPYEVSSAEHFRAINTKGLDKYYKQTVDINLGTINADNTIHAYVVENFMGNYDGNGKKVTYTMTIKVDDTNENKDANIGLFSVLSSGAVVKNLTINTSSIGFEPNTSVNKSNTQRYMGFICGKMEGTATISNCCINNSRVNISGFQGKVGYYVHVAGAVGSMEGGLLQGISYSCEPTPGTDYTLDGLSCVGGMVANMVSDSAIVIERCLFRGSLRVQGFSASSCANVGGIVGRVQKSKEPKSISIRNCYVDATAIVSENTIAKESVAAGIAVLARSVDIHNCYADIGSISVVPSDTYNAVYPLSGKVNDNNSESNETFRAGCENSAATVGVAESNKQYYHTQSAGSVAPLMSQTSPQGDMQEELVYLGDDFVEVCSTTGEVETCKIELKFAIKGHIYSNKDGDFSDLYTWQNYVNPVDNPNAWQDVLSIDIKNKVTISQSENSQITLGNAESRLPIKIRKDAALILENGHNFDLSHVDITIEDGGSFVNATSTDMKGVITKEIYPNMWNFVGMAGHTDMEPLHDAYRAAQPAGCLRFWALKYDYENNVWDENNYLMWNADVGVGEGVLIYTNGNNVFVDIDDKTNDDDGEATPTIVNFVNNEVSITNNVGQNSNGNWLALANPYPARLDASKVLNGITTETNGEIQGMCVYVRNGSEPYWNTECTNIEAAQGFFVNFALGGDKSVTLRKTMLSNYPATKGNTSKIAANDAGEFLRVSVASEGYRVPVMYRQNDAASADYDIFDADKLFGSGTVAEPYFALGERMLCKQEADSTHFVTDLNIRSEQSRSVEIIAEYIPEGYTLSLIDDNNETVMNQDDVYTADIARGDNEGRFKLVINKNNVSIEDVAQAEEIRLYNNNRQITIQGGNIKSVQVFNTLGQKVYETKQRHFTLGDVPSGTYIVNVQTAETSFSNKIVVH